MARTFLWLFLSLAIVATGIVFINRQNVEERPLRLFPEGLEKDKVIEILITGKDGLKADLTKENGQWYIKDGQLERADGNLVDVFLTRLMWSEVKDAFSGDKKMYGIDDLSGRVELRTEDASWVIEIGQASPVGDFIYVFDGKMLKLVEAAAIISFTNMDKKEWLLKEENEKSKGADGDKGRG